MTSTHTTPDHFANPVLATSACQLAAVIPYFLGFVPSESIVVVCLDTSNNVPLTVRYDTQRGLTPANKSAAAHRQYMEPVLRRLKNTPDITAVLIFGYLCVAPKCDGTQFQCDICIASQVLAESGLAVVESGRVCDKEWIRHQRGRDFERQRLDSAAAVRVASELVAQGYGFFPTRTDLERMVTGPGEQSNSQVIHVFDFAATAVLVRAKESRWRRRQEDRIVRFLCGPVEQKVARPSTKTVATWIVSMADPRLREPVLYRLLPDRQLGVPGQVICERLAWLVRQSPKEYAAHPSACLAVVAWQSGNGALALIAAQHALRADAGNVLADLVQRAVSVAMPPTTWIELMRASSLKQLRSGITRAS